MIHTHIITLGKLKESFWRDAEIEYSKRLTPYIKITVHELREESFDEKIPPEIVKEKESEKIFKELDKIRDGFIVALGERGTEYTSPEFAQFVAKKTQLANTFIFIIGGPLGLSESVFKRANHTISLSRLTFTHQEARIILLEQLYRVMMINANRTYHY